MSGAIPIEAVFDGDVFRPINSWWVARARKHFTVGEVLHLVDEPERSSRSHNHFHAAIKNAWDSLPPLMTERFPSPTHLRKYALVKAGYFHSQSMPCGTPEAAKRFAAFVKPLDEFSIVIAKGSMVTVYTAKSTAYRSMPKDEFQKAKDASLAVIAEMIGVSSRELQAQQGAA